MTAVDVPPWKALEEEEVNAVPEEEIQIAPEVSEDVFNEAIAAAMTPFGNGNQAAASVLIIAAIVIAQAVIEIKKEKDEKAFTGHRYIYAFAMLTVIALFGVAGKSSFMYQAF